MKPRYQIFVSSTFSDLKTEREKVIRTLMEMDCIPASMELFPAADEEQFEFIKKIIDGCDYYILLIAGKYGSLTPEGISYTEKEYDYAVEKGIKVIAFLHGDIETLPPQKLESKAESRDKLDAFRKKVSEKRLVKTWTEAPELPGLVSLSLQKTFTTFPATGWVRANIIANEDLLSEINVLRKENELLKENLNKVKNEVPVSNLDEIASLDETFKVNGKYKSGNYYPSFDSEATWSDIFSWISPHLIHYLNDQTVKNLISEGFAKKAGVSGKSCKIEESQFKTIMVQFKALGLIKTNYLETTMKSMALFWILTKKGEALMYEINIVKKSK